MSLSSVRMMDTYTRMIRKNFPMEEHRFLYWDPMNDSDRGLLEYGNSAEITGKGFARVKQLCEEMDRADVIIWHGLMFGAKRAFLLLLLNRYFAKSVWIMRGIDLYNWKILDKGFKSWFVNQINYQLRKRMPYVASIFPTDEPVYVEQFGTKSKLFSLTYPMSESAFDFMEKYWGCKPRPNGKVYIQVAHNAYAFNNHMEILEGIKQFKDEDIRVIIPLSYGNNWYNQKNNYGKQVADQAEEYFGSKAVSLTQFMPADKYTELLCNIDISIYGAARQNGLGNILRSLYIGNKVYLSNKNPLYHYFKEQNIDIYEMESIPKQSFEEFCKPSDASNAVAWIRKMHYPDAVMYRWKALFDYFKNGESGAGYEKEMEKQIDAILERDFSVTASERMTKSDYVDLTEYCAERS